MLLIHKRADERGHQRRKQNTSANRFDVSYLSLKSSFDQWCQFPQIFLKLLKYDLIPKINCSFNLLRERMISHEFNPVLSRTRHDIPTTVPPAPDVRGQRANWLRLSVVCRAVARRRVFQSLDVWHQRDRTSQVPVSTTGLTGFGGTIESRNRHKHWLDEVQTGSRISWRSEQLKQWHLWTSDRFLARVKKGYEAV